MPLWYTLIIYFKKSFIGNWKCYKKMLITFTFSIKSFLKWFSNACLKAGMNSGGAQGVKGFT